MVSELLDVLKVLPSSDLRSLEYGSTPISALSGASRMSTGSQCILLRHTGITPERTRLLLSCDAHFKGAPGHRQKHKAPAVRAATTQISAPKWSTGFIKVSSSLSLQPHTNFSLSNSLRLHGSPGCCKAASHLEQPYYAVQRQSIPEAQESVLQSIRQVKVSRFLKVPYWLPVLSAGDGLMSRWPS